MKIIVPVGDFKFGVKGDIFHTDGIGSCVVIVLYERFTKTGIMLHSILPNYISNSRPNSFLKYVDSGIYIALSDLYRQTSKRDIVAKITGGAKLTDIGNKNIGFENIISAKKILNEENISIISEDTGGDFGRVCEFDLNTGNMHINTLLRGEYII
ncbi:MAG: chemotaxis protein CheD [Candidatus Muirbacterium halophilum]|nr:chemotaxis protein CheD [Candidatus Muirbacterium halophilum]MCK9474787.1 chemotaxis protein CheD [Candidatus Muirbacterium halophilum]